MFRRLSAHRMETQISFRLFPLPPRSWLQMKKFFRSRSEKSKNKYLSALSDAIVDAGKKEWKELLTFIKIFASSVGKTLRKRSKERARLASPPLFQARNLKFINRRGIRHKSQILFVQFEFNFQRENPRSFSAVRTESLGSFVQAGWIRFTHEIAIDPITVQIFD